MEQPQNAMDIKLEDIYDVALLSHGFMPYGRDYYFNLETNWTAPNGGRYQLVFHHCYQMSYLLDHDPDLLKNSWDDLFIDYDKWQQAGKPEGFLWSTNWMLLYPGFTVVKDSERAAHWTNLLGRTMQEILLDMEIVKMNFVIHSWSLTKTSDETELISQVQIPLQRFNFRKSD